MWSLNYIVNKTVHEVILFWGTSETRERFRELSMTAMTLSCTHELPTDSSLWYVSAEQCCNQAIKLFPCTFIAIDFRAFQDQAWLKQRREPPRVLIPPLTLLVGGQVINMPNGQICLMETKREQLHVSDLIKI